MVKFMCQLDSGCGVARHLVLRYSGESMRGVLGETRHLDQWTE